MRNLVSQCTKYWDEADLATLFGRFPELKLDYNGENTLIIPIIAEETREIQEEQKEEEQEEEEQEEGEQEEEEQEEGEQEEKEEQEEEGEADDNGEEAEEQPSEEYPASQPFIDDASPPRTSSSESWDDLTKTPKIKKRGKKISINDSRFKLYLKLQQ